MDRKAFLPFASRTLRFPLLSGPMGLAETTDLPRPPGIDDLSDDILCRIFSFVLGPVRRQEHFINHRITVRHDHMEPTFVSNFDDIQYLPLVCKRWRRIVETSDSLWQKVHVSTALLRIPRTIKAWLRVAFWLSRHSHKFDSLHLADEASFRDNSLDTVKIGALASLSRNLRVLHLDHCFHRGANSDLLGILPLIKLEQLQISCVNHDFMNGISALSSLTTLKRLQVQGNADYWDCNGPALILAEGFLPKSLQVLSLANVRVRGVKGCEQPLQELKVLELVYIEWIGAFLEPVSKLRSLETLWVLNCDKVVKPIDHDFQEASWGVLSGCPNLTDLELSNSKYGDFCAEGCRDVSGVTALTNLRRLVLCPEVSAPCRERFFLGGDMSSLVNLKELHLNNFGLSAVPRTVFGIPNLTVLSLSGNGLANLPEDLPKFRTSLQVIHLCHNNFQEISNCLQHFTRLEEIHISNNPLVFSKNMEFLLQLPFLRLLSMGSGELSEVFPFTCSSQVEDICKELKLSPAGAFRLGSLCSSLRHKSEKFKVYL